MRALFIAGIYCLQYRVYTVQNGQLLYIAGLFCLNYRVCPVLTGFYYLLDPVLLMYRANVRGLIHRNKGKCRFKSN
jgi:hypothetical protein